MTKRSQTVTTYFWKNLECELCKTAYPYETRHKHKLLNIIEYEIPAHTSNYIVIESISSNTSKVIHVIDMTDEKVIYIGRGHDAHVRVTDISVSRVHALIVKSAQGFYYLMDNESKFGTLALVSQPLELKPNTRTQVQISRTLLTLEVREPPTRKICPCLPII